MFIDIEYINLLKEMSKSDKVIKDDFFLEERFYDFEVFGEIVFVKSKIEDLGIYQMKVLNKRKYKKVNYTSFNHLGYIYSNDRFIEKILNDRFKEYSFINLIPDKKEVMYNEKFFYTESFLKKLKIDIDKNLKRVDKNSFYKEKEKYILCIDGLHILNVINTDLLKDINFLIYTTDNNAFKSAYISLLKNNTRIFTYENISGISVIYSIVK